MNKASRCLVLLWILFLKMLFAQNTLPTIETVKLADNLYKFFIYLSPHNSVNLYGFTGKEGTLLIDTGFDHTTELVKRELQKLSADNVKYVINTHSDGDHTWGNAAFADAVIISHAQCREQLLREGRVPPAGLPDVAFQDSLTVYFNGEEICCRAFPGHTSNDIVIHFKKANCVFVGDLILSDSVPIVHAIGDIYQYEKNIDRLSRMLMTGVKIFVGHGRELAPADLQCYREMFVETKKLVVQAIREGKTPEQAKKDNVLRDWQTWNSKLFPRVNTDQWIDDIYSSTDEGRKRSAFHRLSSVLTNSGLDAMLAEYRRLVTNKDFYFTEAEFNSWGYALLAEKKYDLAITVFKIVVELYPQSWNAYDSLGEAYAAAGNKKLAVQYYEKSVQLNPQNQNGINVLKKMQE